MDGKQRPQVGIRSHRFECSSTVDGMILPVGLYDAELPTSPEFSASYQWNHPWAAWQQRHAGGFGIQQSTDGLPNLKVHASAAGGPDGDLFGLDRPRDTDPQSHRGDDDDADQPTRFHRVSPAVSEEHGQIFTVF